MVGLLEDYWAGTAPDQVRWRTPCQALKPVGTPYKDPIYTKSSSDELQILKKPQNITVLGSKTGFFSVNPHYRLAASLFPCNNTCICSKKHPKGTLPVVLRWESPAAGLCIVV